MPQFTRATILAATRSMAEWGHAAIDGFALEHSLEIVAVGYSRANKINALSTYLLRNPDLLDEEGRNLNDAVVSALVAKAIEICQRGYPLEFDPEAFQQQYPALQSCLERNGFTVQDGTLRRALPELLDLPKADDEVHTLLDHYGFTISKGHLDQGIAAHARGDWAAANAQFRPAIETLFDAIAEHLAGGAQLPAAGNQRRIWLAKRNPPFLLGDLNEWADDGSGFIQAFFRRLHPAGAHPGLSDEEDSTFRLHTVLLVARLLLRRIVQV